MGLCYRVLRLHVAVTIAVIVERKFLQVYSFGFVCRKERRMSQSFMILIILRCEKLRLAETVVAGLVGTKISHAVARTLL